MKIITDVRPLSRSDSVYTKLTVDHGVIVEFAVVQIADINGQTHQIVRYDCSHGYAHKDCLYTRAQRKERLPERPFDELFRMAIKEVEKEWQRNKSLYMRNWNLEGNSE